MGVVHSRLPPAAAVLAGSDRPTYLDLRRRCVAARTAYTSCAHTNLQQGFLVPRHRAPAERCQQVPQCAFALDR
jgi:hypothetical protein